MEGGGGACFLDEEWESLYKIFSFDTDLDLTQLLAQNSPNPTLFPQSDSSGSSNGSSDYVNSLNHLTQLINNNDQFSLLPQFDHFLVENDNVLMTDQAATMIQRPGIDLDQMDGPEKRKICEQAEVEEAEVEAEAPPLPKKRARVSKNAEKGKRKMLPRKKDDEFLAKEETICDSVNVQNSSWDVSEDESNDSKGVVKKKRASRGAATDPQSLYARRRREKINERLRILQTLVPNGTKVDISTMLEEAVHYVKFLQLQIKLLSSDQMWMYAPLAYNGFDVDFYNRFSPYF